MRTENMKVTNKSNFAHYKDKKRSLTRKKINLQYKTKIVSYREQCKPYMNGRMIKYFKRKLELWKDELKLQKNGMESILALSNQNLDTVDEANNIILKSKTIPEINRANFLITEICKALEKIQNGTYGYCEETGEPIGFLRLEAWPIANLCIDAQEEREKKLS